MFEIKKYTKWTYLYLRPRPLFYICDGGTSRDRGGGDRAGGEGFGAKDMFHNELDMYT